MKIGKILKKYFINNENIVLDIKKDSEIIENSKQYITKKGVLKKNYFTLKSLLLGKIL